LSGHHLDQLHQRRRIEEVHADDPLRLGHPGGDRRHREGGGVRGQDGFRATHLGQLGEQLLLQAQLLRRGLDHELAAGQVLDSRG